MRRHLLPQRIGSAHQLLPQFCKVRPNLVAVHGRQLLCVQHWGGLQAVSGALQAPGPHISFDFLKAAHQLRHQAQAKAVRVPAQCGARSLHWKHHARAWDGQNGGP